jgi:ABC-type antimicrobial peptide transport system permease subunit
MGIRLALGARASDVVRLVVFEGVRPVIAGAAVGLGAGYGLSQAIASLLFAVTPHDPVTFALAPIVMSGAGLAAAWIPARRACRVDPAITLRPE